jgi:hypothetical protein
MTNEERRDHDTRRNIQMRMTQLGVNGAIVSQMLGVTRSALHQRLRGTGRLSRGTVALMSVALVVPVEALRASSATMTVTAPVPTDADWRLTVANALAAGEPYPSVDDLLMLTTSSSVEEVSSG